MKTSFLLFLAGLSLMTVVLGCNMLRGAGQDIENAGESIQKTVGQ
jgi:predicted small secreted protein